jgi:integrase
LDACASRSCDENGAKKGRVSVKVPVDRPTPPWLGHLLLPSEGLGIKGVTLHTYRYAWAERAKCAGYPERFAQEALGHNSKAVHRA